LEHKHFSKDDSDYTYVTREYPADWIKGTVPYYPIGGSKNRELWQKYADKFDSQPGFYRAGRLANYTYIDMDKTIMLTLELFDELEKEGKI
jgi:UDP-galactopyranose mutase